jgi:phosphinothricin acetyltransferase
MLNSAINIRVAVPDDLPGILEIYNDAIINTTAVYSELPHTLEMRQSWYNDRISNGFPVFVAVAGDTIAGFSTFGHFRVWPCYRYTVEHSVYVHINHRRKGISKLLLQPLIDKAKEMKLHAMIAGIDSENEVSLQLHRSFGFVEVAHFREVGFKFGRWLDLKFMQLILPES